LHTFLGISDDEDGIDPNGLIEGSKGALYGTTHWSDTNLSGGTILKLNKDGSGYTVLRRFSGSEGGSYPLSLV